MTARVVARDDIPDSARDQAQSRAGPKGRTPTIVREEPTDNGWRDSGSKPHAGENNSVRDPALRRRNPRGHYAIGCWIYDGLSHSKQQTQCNQDGQGACNVRSDQRDRRGEQSPPDHSQHQNPARSQPIRQPASRSLEERVAEHECAEHTSELYVGEMELFGDGGTGNRDIDTIEISNGADQKHPTDQDPAERCLANRRTKLSQPR